MSGGPEYCFTCPECSERVTVDGPMRDALLSKGCVVCGSAVSARDFTEL